jgi:2-oxoglutarate ferredoxin oxidoreductase subunit alpha
MPLQHNDWADIFIYFVIQRCHDTAAVIIVGQRPGPSTGLSTRTEQADLNFVMHAGHGDFPRAVLAPGYPEQSVYPLSKALNLAHKYQTPVIVLGDQYFNDSYFTIEELDLRDITIDRGDILTDQDLPSPHEYRSSGNLHRRFSRTRLTGLGLDPRCYRGDCRQVESNRNWTVYRN